MTWMYGVGPPRRAGSGRKRGRPPRPLAGRGRRAGSSGCSSSARSTSPRSSPRTARYATAAAKATATATATATAIVIRRRSGSDAHQSRST